MHGCGHGRAAVQRGYVDLPSGHHLGELAAAGDENDLVFQSFLGEKSCVVGNPQAQVRTADGTVTDADAIGGPRVGDYRKEN